MLLQGHTYIDKNRYQKFRITYRGEIEEKQMRLEAVRKDMRPANVTEPY